MNTTSNTTTNSSTETLVVLAADFFDSLNRKRASDQSWDQSWRQYEATGRIHVISSPYLSLKVEVVKPAVTATTTSLVLGQVQVRYDDIREFIKAHHLHVYRADDMPTIRLIVDRLARGEAVDGYDANLDE